VLRWHAARLGHGLGVDLETGGAAVVLNFNVALFRIPRLSALKFLLVDTHDPSLALLDFRPRK